MTHHALSHGHIAVLRCLAIGILLLLAVSLAYMIRSRAGHEQTVRVQDHDLSCPSDKVTPQEEVTAYPLFGERKLQLGVDS
jgi:hypothetical protein